MEAAALEAFHAKVPEAAAHLLHNITVTGPPGSNPADMAAAAAGMIGHGHDAEQMQMHGGYAAATAAGGYGGYEAAAAGGYPQQHWQQQQQQHWQWQQQQAPLPASAGVVYAAEAPHPHYWSSQPPPNHHQQQQQQQQQQFYGSGHHPNTAQPPAKLPVNAVAQPGNLAAPPLPTPPSASPAAEAEAAAAGFGARVSKVPAGDIPPSPFGPAGHQLQQPSPMQQPPHQQQQRQHVDVSAGRVHVQQGLPHCNSAPLPGGGSYPAGPNAAHTGYHSGVFTNCFSKLV
jgi:hypothetical protein